jgi:hypothetical protein
MTEDFDLTMFEPSGNDMRKDYPELKDFKEFELLKAREIKFCWYMGNKTSPLVKKKLKGKDLVLAAVDACYDERAKDVNATVKAIMNGDIPRSLLDGIARMSSFNPSYRLRAKWMNEYVFEKLNSLVVLDSMAETAMNLDPDQKKKYADLAIKISSEMPDLVTRMETGYGVKLEKKAKGGEILTGLSDQTDRITD